MRIPRKPIRELSLNVMKFVLFLSLQELITNDFLFFGLYFIFSVLGIPYFHGSAVALNGYLVPLFSVYKDDIAHMPSQNL